MSYTLPSGESLTLGAAITPVPIPSSNGSAWSVVAEPAWAGGGAFGHGAYNNISGEPIFYICCNEYTAGATVILSSMTVKDKSGNARNFLFYAADGENTDGAETITYKSTASWTLVDAPNPYNGGIPALLGVGTATVVENEPATGDQNQNASVVLQTTSPTQVSVILSGNEAALFALALPPVTFNISVAGRISPSDQFVGAISYTTPLAAIKSVATSGTGASTGSTPVLAGNSVTLSAAMASGSIAALSNYTGTMSCKNYGAANRSGSGTVLPSGTGTSFALTPQLGDNITCTLTLSPPPGPTLTPSGAKTSPPGAEAFYPHIFQAGSAGTVAFSLAPTATPSAPPWTQVLYQDSNCNGVLDTGEPEITGSISVVAGQRLCLVAAVFVPAGTQQGAQSALQVGAAFTSPVAALNTTLTVTDVTTVGTPSALVLTKAVADVTLGSAAATADAANPGDILLYTLTGTNDGTQPLNAVVISDATPAFTTFLSGACPSPLPSGITACSLPSQPTAGTSGAVQWTFTGSLAPGGSLSVTYRVKIGS